MMKVTRVIDLGIIFIIMGFGMATYSILFEYPNPYDFTMSLFVITIGFIIMLIIRIKAMTYLLAQTNPQFTKLMSMDFDELEKEFKKIKKDNDLP